VRSYVCSLEVEVYGTMTTTSRDLTKEKKLYSVRGSQHFLTNALAVPIHGCLETQVVFFYVILFFLVI
jgi:hypothetical protein